MSRRPACRFPGWWSSGVGKPKDLKPLDIIKLGGKAVGKLPQSCTEVTILADLPSGAMKPDQAADLALGAQLRAYAFERYKTKRKEGEEEPALAKVTVGGRVSAVRGRARPGHRARRLLKAS